MHYYQHHIGDYAQATAHLTLVEDAIYSRMLRWYYAEESPLPNDLRAICRIVRACTEDERAAVESVLADFFERTEEGYRQRRCDAEIGKYHGKSDKAKTAAKARWDANAMRTQCERNADASGNHANASENDADAMPTKNQEPKTKNQDTDAPVPVAVSTKVKPKPQSKRERDGPTLTEYIAEQKVAGLKMVPEDHHVFKYATKIGLSVDMLHIAWQRFRDHYVNDERAATKRYKDWPGVFRNAVEGNWLKLWYQGESGWALTVAGRQAELKYRSEK